MAEKAMTVGELIRVLSDLPADRDVYVRDDSIEYPMNHIVPDWGIWTGGDNDETRPVVLITWEFVP